MFCFKKISLVRKNEQTLRQSETRAVGLDDASNWASEAGLRVFYFEKRI